MDGLVGGPCDDRVGGGGGSEGAGRLHARVAVCAGVGEHSDSGRGGEVHLTTARAFGVQPVLRRDHPGECAHSSSALTLTSG